MIALVALWALAEATLFFIVADLPIMAVGIRWGWRRAMMAALVAAVFAALGGALVWYWASIHPKDAIRAMVMVPGIDLALVGRAAELLYGEGLWGMTRGSFSGVPYKLFAVAAGARGDSLPLFMLASVVARLPRFVLVGTFAGVAGPRLRARFGARPVWFLFAIAWTAFYALYLGVLAR